MSSSADLQSLVITDDAKERLKRLVIGVATISADHFRECLDCLARMICRDPDFAVLFRTSAVWIWVKDND